MSQLLIDRSELVRSIAQLTHVGIDRTEWPWIVSFEPGQEETEAAVLLPGRVNSAGGFDEPMGKKITASPLAFSNLSDDYSWGENTPVVGPESDWDDPALAQLQETLQQSLKEEVEIEGVHYRIQYK